MGAVALLSALAIFVTVAGWFAQLIVEQQTALVASQVADRIAQSTNRGIVSYDNTLQTVIGGTQNPASLKLSPQERNALLAERTPKDPQIVFLDVLDAGATFLQTWRKKLKRRIGLHASTSPLCVTDPPVDCTSTCLVRRVRPHSGCC